MKRSSTSKPGCKGDPRMNRAVQARLENPEMPLFHALRVGGFDFPANEDASTLDNDQVTLGQRKNQLLRRLRQLARKQEKEESEQAQQQANEQAQQQVQQQAQQQQQQQATQQHQPQQLQQALAVSTDTVGSGGLENLYQQLQQHSQQQIQQVQQQVPLQLNPSLPSNQLQLQLASAADLQQGHQIMDFSQSSGTKRQAPSMLDMLFGNDGQGGGGGKRLALQQALQQEQVGSLRSMTQNQMQQAQIQQPTQMQQQPTQMQQQTQMQQTRQLPSTLAAHTMGNQIILPTEVGTLFQLRVPTPPDQHQQSQDESSEDQKPHALPLHHLQQSQSLLGTGARFPGANSAPPAIDPPAPTAHDQQSQASSTTTQPPSSQLEQQQQSQQQQQQQQASSAPGPPYSAEALQVKETAALRVFQQELQTLYCRSMLAAGYSAEDTTQRSPYFRRFAFHAWKQECERLQGILGDVEVESFLPHTQAQEGESQPPAQGHTNTTAG